MSEGKNIEIKIAATGGDQAAEEIRKVGEAAEATTNNPNTTRGFGGMLDAPAINDATAATVKLNDASKDSLTLIKEAHERADERFKDIEKEVKELEKLADAAEKQQAKEAESARRREVGAAMGAIGIAAGLAAKALANVYEQLGKVDTVELRKLDSVWADQIEGAKSFAAALEDPLGALAALANGGTTVQEAFADMNEQLALNAGAMSAETDRLIEKAKPQVAAIEALAKDIKTANQLLSAQQETDSAIQDGADAEAIRGGADPNDVRAARARKDEAAKIAAIEADQEAPRAGMQERFDLARSAKAAADEAAQAKDRISKAGAKVDAAEEGARGINDQMPADEAWARRNQWKSAKADFEATKQNEGAAAAAAPKLAEEAKKRQDEFDEQKRAVADADALANQRKATVRAVANNTVADAMGDKAASAKQKEEREAAKAVAEAQREAAKAAAQAQRSEREAGSRNAGAAQAGREAERLLPKGVSEEFAKSVQKAAQGLQNGDQGGELKKLVELMHQLADAAQVKGTKKATDIAALEQKIAVLTNQRKNNR